MDQSTSRTVTSRRLDVTHAAANSTATTSYWRTVRDRTKFENMISFGACLSAVRAQVLKDLVRDGLDRERVIAAIVRLLDRTGLRVGNDSYLRENHTSGLTTLSKRAHPSAR